MTTTTPANPQLVQEVFAEVNKYRPTNMSERSAETHKLSANIEALFVTGQTLRRLGFDTDGLGFYDRLKEDLETAYQKEGIALGTTTAQQMVRNLDDRITQALDKRLGTEIKK